MPTENNIQTNPFIRANRIRTLALAALRRAEESGIPEKFLRIGMDDFKKLLNSAKAADIPKNDGITSFIFETPAKMFDLNFILIDGASGISDSRSRAGSAVLFRAIACDKNGLYVKGHELTRMFSMPYPNGLGGNPNRSEYLEILRDKEVLFIDGLCPDMPSFRPDNEIGSYVDELLSSRHQNDLLTVISFTKPLGRVDIVDDRAGQYLGILSRANACNFAEAHPELKFLHINVK